MMIKQTHIKQPKYKILKPIIILAGFVMMGLFLPLNSSYAKHIDNHSNTSKTTNTDTNNATQILNKMLDDEDYIIHKTTKKLKRIENKIDISDEHPSFLEKIAEFIRRLFFNDNSIVTQQRIFIFLKVILILLLMLILYKVWQRRHRILNFFSIRIKKRQKPVSIQAWSPTKLLQGWEDLPAHTQIPDAVKQLLNNQKIIDASSLLYRASLRWLVQQQNVAISPANTELQCQQQIKKINQYKNLPSNQAKFLSQIIATWIPLAYSDSKQQDILTQQLIELTHQWLNILPAPKANPQIINNQHLTGGNVA